MEQECQLDLIDHMHVCMYIFAHEHSSKKKKATSKTYNLRNYHPSSKNWNPHYYVALYVITNNVMGAVLLKIKWQCLKVVPVLGLSSQRFFK